MHLCPPQRSQAASPDAAEFGGVSLLYKRLSKHERQCNLVKVTQEAYERKIDSASSNPYVDFLTSPLA